VLDAVQHAQDHALSVRALQASITAETAQPAERGPIFPLLDFAAQQTLLSDLLTPKDAPPVTASETDALDARAQVDAAASAATTALAGNGVGQGGGSAIGSEILAELEGKMSAGSELLANVEARAPLSWARRRLSRCQSQ